MIRLNMYVFGGIKAFIKFLDDFWVFGVETERWSEVKAVIKGPDLSDVWPCAYFAASTQGQLYLSVSCDTGYLSGMGRCKDVLVHTWMFVIHLRTWYLIAIYQLNETQPSRLEAFYQKVFTGKDFSSCLAQPK